MITIDEILDQILSNNLIIRLKDVVENGKGWHTYEKTYDHLIKTKNIAKQALDGNFITNPDAKKQFILWADNSTNSLKQKDLSTIIALIHDCGKILSYKEADREYSLKTTTPGVPDEFMFPGHEYWGARIVVPELLKNIDIPQSAKSYIALIIENHGFFSTYFLTKTNWSIKDLIKSVKSHYAGHYIAGLFNMYSDGFDAPAFKEGKMKIEELFNEPSFYTPRTYFIPDE